MTVPMGMATPVDEETARDSLRTRLEEARRQGGRGSLNMSRRLWRYCGDAFRDWCGGRLVHDAPVVEAKPLSNLELVELLKMAQEMPAVIRDLLRLRAESRVSKRQVVLRALEWSPERRQMLIELHRIALFAAGAQLGRAQIALGRVTADRLRGNYEKSCEHAQRMVRCYENQIVTLEDQLHALTAES